jgi:hypothetical protein
MARPFTARADRRRPAARRLRSKPRREMFHAAAGKAMRALAESGPVLPEACIDPSKDPARAWGEARLDHTRRRVATPGAG